MTNGKEGIRHASFYYKNEYGEERYDMPLAEYKKLSNFIRRYRKVIKELRVTKKMLHELQSQGSCQRCSNKEK
jgi:hypothetical protein